MGVRSEEDFYCGGSICLVRSADFGGLLLWRGKNPVVKDVLGFIGIKRVSFELFKRETERERPENVWYKENWHSLSGDFLLLN